MTNPTAPTNNPKSQTPYNVTLLKATPAQMVNRLKLELSTTPRWRVFKRIQIKRMIKFWKKEAKLWA
jgi:hypothetical protein